MLSTTHRHGLAWRARRARLARPAAAGVACALLLGAAWLAVSGPPTHCSGVGCRRLEAGEAPVRRGTPPAAQPPLPVNRMTGIRLTASTSTLAASMTGLAALTPATQRLLREFLLNGLLVPLLDDAGGGEGTPLRWADPSLMSDCAPPSQPSLDGGPLPVGRALHGRAFTLQWQLHECRPFGSSGPQLSGTVEMAVFPENSGLSASVRLRGLTVEDGDAVVAVDDWRGAANLRWTL